MNTISIDTLTALHRAQFLDGAASAADELAAVLDGLVGKTYTRRYDARMLECGEPEQGAVFDAKLLKCVFDAVALTACKATQVEFVQHGAHNAASLHWVSLEASFDVVVMPMRRI